jgi:hypothetical protein
MVIDSFNFVFDSKDRVQGDNFNFSVFPPNLSRVQAMKIKKIVIPWCQSNIRRGITDNITFVVSHAAERDILKRVNFKLVDPETFLTAHELIPTNIYNFFFKFNSLIEIRDEFNRIIAANAQTLFTNAGWSGSPLTLKLVGGENGYPLIVEIFESTAWSNNVQRTDGMGFPIIHEISGKLTELLGIDYDEFNTFPKYTRYKNVSSVSYKFKLLGHSPPNIVPRYFEVKSNCLSKNKAQAGGSTILKLPITHGLPNTILEWELDNYFNYHALGTGPIDFEITDDLGKIVNFSYGLNVQIYVEFLETVHENRI